jgi:hypothetical protein
MKPQLSADCTQLAESARMNVLFSTHTGPDYMPPLVVSERQIIVGPCYFDHVEDGLVKHRRAGPGRYDLAALVASLPPDQKPDLTIVLADSHRACVPYNLGGVPGRKLLLVADTHHGDEPIQTLLSYARQEPFDRIVVTHDPHHLHWFTEAGIAPAMYIPNVNCCFFPCPLIEQRQRGIVFVGQAGQRHPRRQFLLDAIRKAGLPLLVQQAPARAAAERYNSFQITFNCSLNGDLNMRTFEVMAAGGFLLTDRLSPQSGMETLFRRGVDYVDYENLGDLLDKLRYFLSRPDECLRIAKAGHAAYVERHQPKQRVRDLLDFVFGCPTSVDYHDRRAIPAGGHFGSHLDDRVRIYDFLQALALRNERVIISAESTIGPRAIADMVDLPRLEVHVHGSAGQDSAFRTALAQLGALEQIHFPTKRPAGCDIQLIDARTLDTRGHSDLYAPFVALWSAGTPPENGTNHMVAAGYCKLDGIPWLYRRA